MSYEVCPGQAIICGGTRYPEGSLVSGIPGLDELEAAGVVRLVDDTPKPRPQPTVKEVLNPSHAGFDEDDPVSATKVPLRFLADCLATVSDVDKLRAMHEVEGRKGGLDKIEERIGELTA